MPMPQTLSEQDRIIAIGDIHGCVRTLERLMERLSPKENDQLVFLGDYIDRGPSSREIISFLLELQQRHVCFFIMGNHEQMYLDHLKTGRIDFWLNNGGKATLRSYGSRKNVAFPEKHHRFLSDCRYYIETDHYFFTHGGLDPELSIKNNLRYYKSEAFCWQRKHMQASLLQKQAFPWEKTLVCAHTPVEKPVLLDNLIAIDTGCVYHDNPELGNLTAVVLPDRKIVQTKYCD